MDCSSLMFEYDLVCLRLSAAGRRGALRFFYSRSNNSNGRDGGFCDPSARKSHRSDSGPYGSCGSLRSSLRGGDDSPSNRNTRNPLGGGIPDPRSGGRNGRKRNHDFSVPVPDHYSNPPRCTGCQRKDHQYNGRARKRSGRFGGGNFKLGQARLYR